MDKLRGGGLLVVAVVLVSLGLFLRWDLIDWLIDAVGLLFIAGGVVAGVIALLQLFSSRKSAPTGA